MKLLFLFLFLAILSCKLRQHQSDLQDGNKTEKFYEMGDFCFFVSSQLHIIDKCTPIKKQATVSTPLQSSSKCPDGFLLDDKNCKKTMEVTRYRTSIDFLENKSIFQKVIPNCFGIASRKSFYLFELPIKIEEQIEETFSKEEKELITVDDNEKGPRPYLMKSELDIACKMDNRSKFWFREIDPNMYGFL